MLSLRRRRPRWRLPRRCSLSRNDSVAIKGPRAKTPRTRRNSGGNFGIRISRATSPFGAVLVSTPHRIRVPASPPSRLRVFACVRTESFRLGACLKIGRERLKRRKPSRKSSLSHSTARALVPSPFLGDFVTESLGAKDLDLAEEIRAEFEEAGVLVQFGAVGDGGNPSVEADMVEFLEGEDIKGDGVESEAQFVRGGGVMEEASLAAFVLADEGIDDVQGDAVGYVGLTEDLGYGAGEERGVGFEAEEIVGGGAGDGVKDAADAGQIMIQERGDEDVSSDFPGEQPAEVRFSSGDFIGDAGGGDPGELEISEDQLAEDGVFVGILGFEAGVCRASESDAEAGGDVVKAGRAQVDKTSIPENDAVPRMAGVDQAADDGERDGGTGAAGGTG